MLRCLDIISWNSSLITYVLSIHIILLMSFIQPVLEMLKRPPYGCTGPIQQLIWLWPSRLYVRVHLSFSTYHCVWHTLNAFTFVFRHFQQMYFALCLYEWTDEEGSGPFAVIIIPSLLALSTLIVVSQIIWSFVTKRSSARCFNNGVWNKATLWTQMSDA